VQAAFPNTIKCCCEGASGVDAAGVKKVEAADAQMPPLNEKVSLHMGLLYCLQAHWHTSSLGKVMMNRAVLLLYLVGGNPSKCPSERRCC
jgi:hypothetical protein